MANITQEMIDRVSEHAKLRAQAGVLNEGPMPITSLDLSVLSSFIPRPALVLGPHAVLAGIAATAAVFLFNHFFATKNLHEIAVTLK